METKGFPNADGLPTITFSYSAEEIVAKAYATTTALMALLEPIDRVGWNRNFAALATVQAEELRSIAFYNIGARVLSDADMDQIWSALRDFNQRMRGLEESLIVTPEAFPRVYGRDWASGAPMSYSA